MLTNAEVAEAEAAYAAAPSTPPDFYSSRVMTDDAAANRALFGEMAAIWNGKAEWLRFTIDEPRRTLWVEGWKTRPYKEAAFDPPYTADQVVDSL